MLRLPHNLLNIRLGPLDSYGIPNDDNLLIHRVLPWDVHLHLEVVLDVPQLRAGLTDDEWEEPLCNFQLLMRHALMCDGVVIVHHDVVDHILSLLDLLIRAREGHLVLLARGRVLRGLWDLDCNAQLILDLPDDNATLPNDIGEVRWVASDKILREVLKLHCTVALFDKLFHSSLSLFDSCRRAGDGEDVAAGVDLSLCLLLDELDLGTLWPNDDAYLLLGDLDSRRGAVALLLFLGGGRCGSGSGGSLHHLIGHGSGLLLGGGNRLGDRQCAGLGGSLGVRPAGRHARDMLLWLPGCDA
mmetsp:Transcript_117879/g.313583  ORF Transcript_117879/g.313583 Transcript_117879/m.313583 type:complete len:300 (+) Transcript_117879:228-1127(+)